MPDQELYDADLVDFDREHEETLLQEMGLNRNEVHKLRDTMLSPQEAVAAKNEELTYMRQKKGRRKEWEDFTNAQARMGHVMHHSEFIRRLRTIVPNLIVTHGDRPNTLSLYTVVNTPIKEISGYMGWHHSYDEMVKFIGWIEYGASPEYEIDKVDEVQVAIGQTRGWRTVLLRMIARWNVKLDHRNEPELDPHGRHILVSRASFITEAQALDAFGQPTLGPTSKYYRSQLQDFRNGVRPAMQER